MFACKEIINDKTDINKVINILNNLKYKTEVIILSFDESLPDRKSNFSNTLGEDFISRLSKKPVHISQNTRFLSRDEAHER